MSESRIAARWQVLRRARRTALIPYLTAGYPDRQTSLEALSMLAEAGADLVEVGIPFSDPLADGPVIQRASQLALERGMTVSGVLELIARAQPPIPVVAFSYLNPVLAYGLDQFTSDARKAGVSGLLLTDLPAGEDPELESKIRHSGLDLVRLIAPTTTETRLRAALQHASGFVYLISRLGVTGPKTALTGDLRDWVTRLRTVTPLPIAVGFGIATPEQVKEVAAFADGVVVGSALVERLGQSLESAQSLMAELSAALRAATGNTAA